MTSGYDAARGIRARRRQKTLIAYAFLSPSLLVFLVFRHGPALASLILGFFDWSLIDDAQFIGMANYERLVQDDIFWRALKVTIQYTLLAVPPDIVISMALAWLLNLPLRGLTFFRLAYFMPVVTATAIVAIVWRWLYQPVGVINGILDWFGIAPSNWLSDPDLALPRNRGNGDLETCRIQHADIPCRTPGNSS